MFGSKISNKLEDGRHNVQVGENHGQIYSGISIDRHFAVVEQRVAELRVHYNELARQTAKASTAKRELLQFKLEKTNAELEALKAIYRDPSQLIEVTDKTKVVINQLLDESSSDLSQDELSMAKNQLANREYTSAEKILSGIEARGALNASKTAEVLNGLGTIADAKLEWDRAETFYRRAYYSEPTVERLSSLIDLIRRRGSQAGILQELNTAKKALDLNDGTDDEVRLLVLEATVQVLFGDFDASHKAIKIASEKQKKLGDIITAIDITLCKATIFVVENNHRDALKCYKKILNLIDNSEQNDDLFRLRILGNLAATHAEIGNLNQAIALTKQSLRELDKPNQFYQYHYAIRLNNLGDFLGRKDKFRLAIKTLNKAINIGVDMLPADHPSLIVRRTNLAWSLIKNNQAEKAIISLKEIKYDISSLDVVGCKSAAKAMWMLYETCFKNGWFIDALQALSEVQKIKVEHLGSKANAHIEHKMIEQLREQVMAKMVAT